MGPCSLPQRRYGLLEPVSDRRRLGAGPSATPSSTDRHHGLNVHRYQVDGITEGDRRLKADTALAASRRCQHRRVSVAAMSASADQSRERQIRRVRDRNIVAGVLAGVIRNWLTASGPLRSHLFLNLWIELKRYGAPRVSNIELSQIRGIDQVRVDGPVRRHSPLVLTALSMLLECETIFELGPDMGGITGLLAENLPSARIFLLDGGAPPDQAKVELTDHLYHLPQRRYGGRLDASRETGRVMRLSGDSFTFDFLPHSGTADLVYIEGSRRYSHIESDTEAAFGLLSELGTIVWDGYSGDAGVYSYLNDLAPSLDRPVFHILGTRLALYSRWDIAIEAE